MKPQRPYLLRAMYDWISDSGEIPYLLIDAAVTGVVVPEEHVEDGQIVLNVGINAIRDLQLGEDFVMFSSRFEGRAMEIVLPMASIKAIYCKDSGEGMAFPVETLGDAKGSLEAEASGIDATQADAPELKSLSTAPLALEGSGDGPEDDAPPSKPTLKLV